MTEEEEALHRQIGFAYEQNRELVFEIHARDTVISDLQNRLAKLEEENATLRLYFRDWCDGHSATTRADFIGPPAAS